MHITSYLRHICTPLALFAALVCFAAERPNVVVIMTDDQGYGDLGAHGHPFLKTPALDRLHRESVRFTDFHVAPMCTPTRSQFLTGVDAVRNGATAVCQGRSAFRRELPTIANDFAEAGYATALVGKWHLGDSYPYRPQDRGFQEVLANRAWGMPALASHWANSPLNLSEKTDSYHNPLLEHNGKDKRVKGYVTDILFDHAMSYMAAKKKQDQPFFVYLATQTPHVPNIPRGDWQNPYPKKYEGVRIPGEFYGMITNLDENFARLEAFLKKQNLKDNTILVFLTDNGSQSKTAAKIYNAGMRGHKTHLWEGGHRVPCFIRWPKGGFRHGHDIDALTQVQDLLPTLLELSKIEIARRPIDGKSLVPLLRETEWAHHDRTIFIQYRISADTPWAYGLALRRKWRLLPDKELYNLVNDISQERNVADEHPEIVRQMSQAYENWHAKAVKGFKQLRPIVLGHPDCPQVTLYASDWLGSYCDNPKGLRNSDGFGYWDVEISRTGRYRIELSRWPFEAEKPLTEGLAASGPDAPVGARPIASATIVISGQEARVKANEGATHFAFELDLPAGLTTLSTTLFDQENIKLCSANYIRVTPL